MLTQLHIRNFKAWQDTHEIRLAPLTVFFGTNSSGKTSLLQFLLMLKQTIQSMDRKRVLDFGDSHDLVELGVWPEMVFRRDASRTLGFSLKWQGLIHWDYTEEEPEEENLAFEAEIGILDDAQASVGLKSFNYHVRPQSQNAEIVGIKYIGNGKYNLWSGSSDKKQKESSYTVSAPPTHFHGLPTEPFGKLVTRFRRTEELQSLQDSLEQELDSIQYLGPIRMEPQRLYVWAGDRPEDVGPIGEDTIGALLAARERRFKPAAGQDEVGLDVLVAQWLQQMGILESFKLKAIAANRKEYEVFVRVAGMIDEVNLTDVGFGVSQILPVLVQLLYVERRSTLIFEQPELHLHPRAQSALADVFIDALGMQEEGKDRKIQLLVESHSEHFLRRLQRRIAEERLAPDQVALYFCKPGPEGSSVEELKLDEYGNISNWPENFFGDEVGDLAAMTEAAMRRQLGPEGK
jgi:predicted ATPase